MFFTTTVTMEDGTQLTGKDLIHRLDQDLVYYSFRKCHEYEELFCFSVTTEVSKYETAIQWIRRLLWSSENTITKLPNKMTVMKQSIPNSLRDASSTMSDIQLEELYTDRSTKRAFTARRLIQWIPAFERQLKEDIPGVVKKLKRLRAICAYLGCLYSLSS
jgi:Zn-dependent M16 (insulinase) family peptidase